MARDWSRLENEATVSDHIVMLKAYLRGEPYNKAEHRRSLQRLLDERSEQAIEWKHRNISAILIELGHPYIPGYKPAYNYQQMLFETVVEHIVGDRDLAHVVGAHVDASPARPTFDDILSTLVDPPPPRDRPEAVEENKTVRRRAVDYLAKEAHNSALGLEGERYALDFERHRLLDAGRGNLADSIEHAAVVEGDGAGFDIHSYETDGTDRFIEVKTTAYGIYTPVYFSRNELLTSKNLNERYYLYRAFEFRTEPRMFTVAGALSRTCRSFEPTQYIGRIA